jgi:hypothetical protein
MDQLIKEHNKRLKPTHSYEPRQHSVKDTRAVSARDSSAPSRFLLRRGLMGAPLGCAPAVGEGDRTEVQRAERRRSRQGQRGDRPDEEDWPGPVEAQPSGADGRGIYEQRIAWTIEARVCHAFRRRLAGSVTRWRHLCPCVHQLTAPPCSVYDRPVTCMYVRPTAGVGRRPSPEWRYKSLSTRRSTGRLMMPGWLTETTWRASCIARLADQRTSPQGTTRASERGGRRGAAPPASPPSSFPGHHWCVLERRSDERCISQIYRESLLHGAA